MSHSIVNEVFEGLKEKQMMVLGIISESVIEELKSWKNAKAFNGHYEIYVNQNMIVIVDRLSNKIYFVKDSEAEIIKFMKEVQDYIFSKMSNNINVPAGVEITFKIRNYKFHAKVYENEIGVSPTEVNDRIRSFLFANYVVKKKEDILKTDKKIRISIIKDGNMISIKGDTEELSDFLQKQGFQYDKERDIWKKEVNGNGTTVMANIIKSIEKI